MVLFFLCLSLFSPPHCVACTSCGSITPASEGEGERGCRQAGGKGRVETVWSPRSHDGVDGQNGSECTARWVVQGVLRATVWGTYCTTHCTCCTVPTPYSITPQYADVEVLFIIHPLYRPAVLLGLWALACVPRPAFQPKWAAGQRQ